MKVLITRTDRLGDTILASPTWSALSEARPDAEITFLTGTPHLPLFEDDPALAEVIPFPAGDRTGIDALAKDLTSRRFDALVALYVDGDVARLVRRTGAPLKIGPLSKPRTWFLFNRPFRQKRSQVQMHEADYNGRLLEGLGVTYRPRPPRIRLSAEKLSREGPLLSKILGKRAADPFVVLHPGMGGSALNWPPGRYAELAGHILRQRQETIVVTGMPADAPFFAEVLKKDHPRLVDGTGKLDLTGLALLLRRASAFIGPSTGPMHLATAVDTPVIAIFSPLGVQQPRRWGPYNSRGTVVTPDLGCGEKHRCSAGRCPDYDCMERITVDEVFTALAGWLEREGGIPGKE